MGRNKPYTTQLGAGLGLINETKTLFDIWSPDMSAAQLYQIALKSGRFPTITARRLRNIVIECFAPRYLVSGEATSTHLKQLFTKLPTSDIVQIMLIFTCRSNKIFGDFVRFVYWPRYSSGYMQITNEDAQSFVERGIDEGKTSKQWSETTIRRVSAYLTGCCADYGMLERGMRSSRKILSLRISFPVAAYLAYELHFSGVGDNALLYHQDWQLFGMAPEDVLEEIKHLSLKGLLIVQAAGDVIRISWKLSNMEEVCDVITQS